MKYPRTIDINISQDLVIDNIEHLLRNWGLVTKSEGIAPSDKILTLTITLLPKEVEEESILTDTD